MSYQWSFGEGLPRAARDRVTVAAVAFAIGAAGIALASRAFLGRPPTAPEAAAPQPVDPRASARVEVGGWPQAIAVGEGAVWVSVHVDPGDPGRPGLIRIDPATNEVVARISIPGGPTEVVAGLGAVWASTYSREQGAVIYRIDPGTNEVTGAVEDAGGPMTVGDGVLWASRHDPETLQSSLLRIDPSTNRVDAVVPLPITYPSFDVETGEGSVWVRSSEELVEVDPASAAVISRNVVTGYTHIAVGEGTVWTGGWSDREVVVRFDTRTDRLLEPVGVDGFGIPASVQGGLWFLRGPPRTESLCRLNTVTFEVDAHAPTDEWAPDGGPPPAFDAATKTFWVANLRGTVTRIDLAPRAAEVRPRVTARVEVGTGPQAVAVGEGGVWVAVNEPDSPEAWLVARIDPATKEVTHRIPLFEATDVAVGAGSVWASSRDRGTGQVLVRIDPRRVAVTRTIELGCSRCHLDQIVAGTEAVWVTVDPLDDSSSGEVVRVDPATNTVVARIPVKGDPRDLLVGEGAVWVYSLTHHEGCCVAGGTLYRIDPATDSLSATLLLGQIPPHAGISTPPVVAAGHGYAWTSRRPGKVVRIDPTDNSVEEVGIEGPFYPFSVGEGGIWFRGGTEDAEPIIARLNVETMRVDASLPLPSTAIDATLDPGTGTMWVADYERWVARIDLH